MPPRPLLSGWPSALLWASGCWQLQALPPFVLGPMLTERSSSVEMSMQRRDILTAKWLNPVNSILFPASHLFNLPKHLYGPHTQLYLLLLLLSPAKQPIFHPPDYLIPFDFGRPFFYRISYLITALQHLTNPNPPPTPQ